MNAVVIGGTGLIGSKVVRHLRERGLEVTAASPTTGVNTMTRVGLAEAVHGADVVIDVSDAPSFDDDALMEYFQTSARNIAEAEAAAGVTHHVTLSVVGAERLPRSGYMRAKVAQEDTVRSQAVPYTILRSTQSFELMRTVADAATVGRSVRVSPALVQPVAADDIAMMLADIAGASARHGALEIAGPDRLRFVELVSLMLEAAHDTREVVVAPDAVYYGSVLDDDTLLPGDGPHIGRTHLAEWLRRTVGLRSAV